MSLIEPRRLGRLALSLAAGVLIGAGSAVPAELPQPCASGSCAGGPATWVTSGTASASVVGNRLQIDQRSQNAILNWRSFNVGPDGSVEFRQPGSTSVALNRIFQQDPSRILGSLSANGQVYLINTNGIVFGDGARVNVGGLVASSLDITQQAVDSGIARAIQSRAPAFAARAGADGELVAGAVTVERGATIDSAGGQVLLFAPEISNRGVIRTPDGQTVLAAGSAVYLAPSSDPNLRGLLVQVDAGGTVVNGDEGNRTVADPDALVGRIVAERGNVTLAGLVVKQLGRVSATTSVRANGSVRLQATDGVELVQGGAGGLEPRATRGGDLTVGERAVTEVTPEADAKERQVDVNRQPVSSISMEGRNVSLLSDSRSVATAGNVVLSGRVDPRLEPDSFATTPDDSRVYIAPRAVVDVSGAAIEQPMEANLLRVELRGSQLADNPVQRDGPLRGETVFVDVRRTGVREDGTTWVGTPLADLSGDVAAIQRTVAERSLAGGSIRLQSQGGVLVAPDAVLDVSGGSIRYLDGYMNTSQLVANGRVQDIGSADPLRRYSAVVTSYSVTDDRWGVTRTFQGFGRDPRGAFEAGYVEGKDAGSIAIVAPAIALDGRIDGSIVRGPFQRRPSGAIGSRTLYRAFDQVPLGASLEIGALGTSAVPNRVVGNVRFAPGYVLPGLANANGTPFDPRSDVLPAQLDTLRLRPELIAGDAVSRLTVRANDRIELPAEVTLAAPDDASIDLAAGRVRIAGDIIAPSGTLTIAAELTTATDFGAIELDVLSGASLLARGRWINDNPALGSARDPLVVDGGSVTLAARQGALDVAAGSLIDVSGGAWLDAAGRLRPGTGGSVSIGNTPATELAFPSPISVAGEIRGHSLDRGGRLSLAAGSVCVGAVPDCAADDDRLIIDPSLLEASGFGSYQLQANRGGLELADGTTLRLRQDNLQLPGDAVGRPSDADVLAFAQRTERPIDERRPVDLLLAAAVNPGGQPYTNATFAGAPGLRIGRDALVDADPRASVRLSSNSWMVVSGTIVAPAGQISLELAPTLRLSEFLDGQAIWLDDTAFLSAPGWSSVRTDANGLREGEVLDGGRIDIRADRGYVATSPGSVVDVGGALASLDLRTGSGAARSPTIVHGAGGSIRITSAEGLLLNGALRGRPAAAAGASGGTLSLSLNPSARIDPGSPISLFPLGERRLQLADGAVAVIVQPRTAIPRELNGLGTVDVRTVVHGGFDTLELQAREQFGRFGGPLEYATPGRIEWLGDVELALPRSLTLDAARIGASAGTLTLKAPYVTVGNSTRDAQRPVDALEAGAGALRVDAGLLDLVGRLGIDRVATVNLQASGDIRARGVQATGARSIVGSLASSGDVVLAADQLYPATLSRYEIGVVGNPEGRIEVRPGGARGALYSAGGSLTLAAPTIVQGGVLEAPFGSIELRGSAVELAPGSRTSTSGSGRTMPFGETQGEFDWTYSLLDQQTLVVGFDGFSLPEQRVRLEADDVRLAEGATIDVSGGGDLLAYEWIPGVGGTRDVLSPAVRPGQYAILPEAALDYAAFDPSWSRGAGLQPGAAVTLAGGAGLAAGTYVLLPARYALLPGAYLVSRVDGYRDIQPGESHALLDGRLVVAGYSTVAGTDRRDSRYEGYAIRTGSSIQAEATYTTSLANGFFADAERAAALGAGRLPRDAGLLTLAANRSLSLAAELVSQPGAKGRGAGVDVTAPRLRVGSADSTIEAGEVLLDAAGLERLGAESLLIGGVRESRTDGLYVDVKSQSVAVDGGVSLSGPEIVLAARDLVTVGDGAVLETRAAPGATQDRDDVVLLEGDGAFVRVASARQVGIVREGDTGATGSVEIGAGAVLRAAAGGAIAIDATRDAVSRGTIEVPDGSLSLGSSRVSLGDAPEGTAGLVLDPADIGRLGLDQLVLRSRSTIDLHGTVDLAVRSLTLESGGLRAIDAAAATLRAEETLRLANTDDVATSVGVGGTGRLEISARTVELGAGTYSITGFGESLVSAGTEIVSTDSGTLSTDGALALLAPRLTTVSGAERRIAAGRELRTGPAADGVPADPVATGRLGGTLRLEGQRIVHAGSIYLPAGRVEFLASGTAAADGIRLDAGSRVDVAGAVVTFDGVDVAARGGTVRLAAAAGDVYLDPAATIDVSAAEGGEAGRIGVVAASGRVDLQGRLLGNASRAGAGGRFEADGLSISGFGALNRALESGGFDAARHFRQRGEGSLVLDAGERLGALDVRLAADAGDVVVRGVVDARGPQGGRIALDARDAVIVSGELLASATTENGRGGRISLGARSGATGRIELASGSRVDVGAGAAAANGDAGSLALRIERSRLLGSEGAPAALELSGQVAGTGVAVLEAYQRYEAADGVIGFDDVSPVPGNALFDEAAAFMAQVASIEAQYGGRLEVRPGIEIASDADLVLASDWDLHAWRFEGRPGVLTLRASGDLRVDRSLSDGFAGTSSFRLPDEPGDSWSYRLVAGADTAAADPLAVLDPARLPAGRGSFSIAPGDFVSSDPFSTSDFRMVRTGNGSITVRAARDVRLGNQVSVIYAAGVAGPGIRIPDEFGGLNNLPYPTGGGDVDVAAGVDVVGAISPQLYTDWLWRVGAPFTAPTAWTVNYERFEQGLLSVGGDVRVRAGRDIVNLSAATPAIGRQVGGLAPGQNRVEIAEGGDLVLEAGGSVRGGTYLVGNGWARVSAGDDVGTATLPQDENTRPLDPVFGLMGLARVSVDARREVRIESLVNPTLIPQGNAQNAFDSPTYFSTYAPESRVDLNAVAGDVVLRSDAALVTRAFRSLAAQPRDEVSLRVVPPTLRMASLSRDVQLLGPVAMFPAPRGNLEIYAERDVTGGGSDPVQVLMSDADPDFLPSVAAPQGSLERVVEVLATPLTGSVNFHAAVPVHADSRQPDGVPDLAPARIVARLGSIRLSPERIDDTSGFYLAKQARFVAGDAVQDLGFVTQHLRATDVTSVVAGGDIRYRLGRSVSGGVTDTRREITVDGPGRLELIAGGDVNLQTSGGITTRGDLRVPGLDDEGASVSVLAGIAGRAPDYDGFTRKYLDEGDTYDAALVAYVAEVTGEPVADAGTALERFGQLSPSLRAAFLERVYFAELRAAGRAAAKSGNADYTAGFAALEALFPGANPDVDAGESNAYDGDLQMYFSRIYTLDGGDVALLLPGGEINVGLATPPAAFGLQKSPSQLGLVAQSVGSVSAYAYGDFSVNESRVFAADGGDILVWSTRGDIDAGRGAKTAISSPAPTITFDPNGNPQVTFPPALAGSGIQTIATTPGTETGDVDLYAPRGIVNAGDAGIVAGNLTIGATAVLGADNIQVSGVSVGVPADSGGLGAALTAVSSVGSSASQAASDSVAAGRRDEADSAEGEGEAALSWLEVFVVGLGDEQCDPKDIECLRRQKRDP